MFEQAARLKLRFETPKGSLTVEDLFDLPLTSTRSGANLNDIAKSLNRTLKDAGEEDFVNKSATAADEVLRLKFEIVKHVINVRLAENEDARTKAERKQKKEQLTEILSRKQNAALEAMSAEDIQKMIDTL